MGNLNGRVRRLEGNGGDPVDGPSNPEWRARYSYFRSLMRQYAGVLSPREQAAASRRLASAKGTRAEQIQAVEAAQRKGLGPAPTSAASRAAAKSSQQRYEEWKERQVGYYDDRGIARHLLEDPGTPLESGGDKPSRGQ